MRVLLIDGNNVAHMGGHGGIMSTQGGLRTEVIFNGLKMIKGYLKEFEPDRVAVVWDGGRDDRRKKLFKDYKKREEPKTESERVERALLFSQMETLKDVLVNFGLTNFKVPYREADDVIFNIITEVQAISQGVLDIEYIVVSTDKDFYQLFRHFDSVKIYNPIKKKLWDAKALEEDLGFPAVHYLDYKAMVGDPSDRLPGIKGIGPVGAKIILEYLFLPNPREELDPKHHKWLDKFKDGMSDFTLMKSLMIFLVLPSQEVKDGKIKEYVTQNQLQENAMSLLQHFEFDSLLERFIDFISPFERLLKKEYKNG